MIKHDVEDKKLIIRTIRKEGFKTEIVFWDGDFQYIWNTRSKVNPILYKKEGDEVVVNFNILYSIPSIKYLKIDKVFLNK